MSEATLSLRARLAADPRHTAGVIMGLSYGSLWGVCTVWLRRLMNVYPLTPTGVIFWRDLIVSAMLFGLLASRRALGIQRKHLPLMVVFGLVGIALNNASWSISVNMNGVSVATVLAYSAPIFTVLLSRPIYGEPITRSKLASLGLALVGCLLVSQVYNLGKVGNVQAFGLAMALAVGVFQAGRDLLGKKVGGLYPALTGLFYGFFFGTIFLGLGQATATNLVPHMPARGWVELVVMSGGILVSYALYLGALARLPVSVASILGLTEAVVAAVLAYFVHGEVLSPLQILGALLVVSGVAVLETRNNG